MNKATEKRSDTIDIFVFIFIRMLDAMLFYMFVIKCKKNKRIAEIFKWNVNEAYGIDDVCDCRKLVLILYVL